MSTFSQRDDSVTSGEAYQSGQGHEAVTGGNSGSPLKAIRVSAIHSNIEADLEQAKQELRDTMRGKSNSLEHDAFMNNFFPAASQRPTTSHTNVPNIFKDAPRFSNEKEMYRWLVSVPSTFTA